MPQVYLDYAATTPVRPEVVEAMLPFLSDVYGNPSSIHAFGQEAKSALDNSRDTVADAIGAEPAEITFTSGGTEADNQALIAIMLANKDRGRHLITTQIEHEAVLESAKFLETLGFEVTFLPVDNFGMVSLADVERAIRPDTVLISVMHANNEVGTIQPIEGIASIAKERGVLVHTDAVQTFGLMQLDVDNLGVDLLTLSSHKIYGPKGMGALYVRRGTPILPFIYGGGQERERRSGTENVAAIAGFAKATELMLAERDELADRLLELRDWFISETLSRIPGAELNGHPVQRLANNINISVAHVEGESMLLNLDIAGVAASAGSACTSGSIEPSHVLLAMGVPDERVRGAVRFTLGRQTTQKELSYALDVLETTCKRLVHMSIAIRY